MKDTGRPPVTRSRRRVWQVAASGCLAFALLASTGVATWSAFATNAAAEVSHRAGLVANAYTAARFAVGAEESLERKYRLEPGPDVRAEHVAAKGEVDAAMATVAEYGNRQDRSVAADITARNLGYFKASRLLLAAVDRHDHAAEIAIDHGTVDPVFDGTQHTVYAQADRHLRNAAAADSRLLHIELLARWAASLAVGVAALLILLFARVRWHYSRENAAQGRVNAHQASHDELTGLPNRTRFAELLNLELAASEAAGGSVGVVLLDLDRFKEINDTLGHHCGDRLLQQIGPRIRGVLPGGEVMARLGGDEFALLLPAVSSTSSAAEERTAVTRRVLAALHEPFLVDGVTLAVEASAGIASSPEHGDTGEVLLQHADIAMYLAKSNHEDIAVYDRTLDGHDPRKLTLLSQLRGAGDRGELVLYYQPLVNIHTGRALGAEALLRWQHPTEGLLPPSEFIPLAEGSGFIHELTRHVLNAACAQAQVWQQAGHPLVVSVNISARCLLDSTLPDTVAASLRRAGLPAPWLKLEITESAIIADPVRAQDVITRLHRLGVALSIDDFGTGYTSLAYLRDLPVQELKIDRSFVLRMLSDHKDAVIVRTGVELAGRLGLESVAEGIEDAATLTAISALGCTTAQGYHLARPMPAERFDAWLAAEGGAPTGVPAQAGGHVGWPLLRN